MKGSFWLGIFLVLVLAALRLPSTAQQPLYVGCVTTTPYPLNPLFITSTAHSRYLTTTPNYNASTALAPRPTQIPTLTPTPNAALNDKNLYRVIEPQGMNVRACQSSVNTRCPVTNFISYGDTVRIEKFDNVNGYQWGKIMGRDEWVAIGIIGGRVFLEPIATPQG